MVTYTKRSKASPSDTRKRALACQKRKLEGFCSLIKRNIAQRKQLVEFEKQAREMEILRRENAARKNEVSSLEKRLGDALLELKESDQVHEAVVCKMGQLRKECEDMPDELKRLKKCCDQKDHDFHRLSVENCDLHKRLRHLLSICNRQEQSISQLMEEKKVLCTKGKEPIQKALVAVQALLEIFRDPITLDVAEVDRNVMECGHACVRDFLVHQCTGTVHGAGVVTIGEEEALCPICRAEIYEQLAHPCYELKNATGASLALEKMLREVLATYE